MKLNVWTIVVSWCILTRWFISYTFCKIPRRLTLVLWGLQPAREFFFVAHRNVSQFKVPLEVRSLVPDILIVLVYRAKKEKGKSWNRWTFPKIENLRFLKNYDGNNCIFGIKLKDLSLSFNLGVMQWNSNVLNKKLSKKHYFCQKLLF